MNENSKLTFNEFREAAIQQHPEHESMKRAGMRRWYKSYLKTRKDVIKNQSIKKL